MTQRYVLYVDIPKTDSGHYSFPKTLLKFCSTTEPQTFSDHNFSCRKTVLQYPLLDKGKASAKQT